MARELRSNQSPNKPVDHQHQEQIQNQCGMFSFLPILDYLAHLRWLPEKKKLKRTRESTKKEKSEKEEKGDGKKRRGPVTPQPKF